MHQQNLDQTYVKHCELGSKYSKHRHGRYNSIELSNYVITWEVTQTIDHE